MKFSIITICYNAEEHISSAVRSVIEQVYPDVEYLIVDGASTDRTLERALSAFGKTAVDKFNSKKSDQSFDLQGKSVRIISEPDNGLYDALNKGVRLATGDVIGFVHADDFLAGPSSLLKVANVFMEAPELDAVYGDLAYVDRENTSKITRVWCSGNYSPHKMSRGWFPAHPALYLKRSVYEQYGLFDLDYSIAADVEFMMRIFSKGLKAKYLLEVLMKMRAGGTTGQRQNILDQNRQVMRGMKKNGIPISPLYWPVKLVNRGGQFLKGALSR